MASPAPSPTLDSLRSVATLRQLAPLLSLKPGVLAMQLYKKDKKTSWYTTFEVPKKCGGVRTISAPEPHLKLLQRRVSDLLQKCQDEINLIQGHPESADRQGIAHGFKPHHTIMTNGRVHVGRRYVFNVDLQDFFGVIHFGRVRAFFIKNKNFSLHPKVAEILAHIACFQGKLPQGSPCSPIISNLIAHAMDVRLSQLASSCGVSYTRYADDLTFSSNMKEFPSAIAKEDAQHEWVPGKILSKVVAKNGFSFNVKKTRMQYRDSRQEVTGLTVNHKVNVPASYRYTTRAMVDRLFRTGNFAFVKNKIDAFGNVSTSEEIGNLRQLLGRLMHADRVDVFNQRLRIKNGLPPFDTRGREGLLRRFLYYFQFYAPEQPVIVCEGKTDNIYLRCAIKSRAALFPTLIDTGVPPKLKIRLFKYTERRISAVTDLSGGVGGVCKLIKNYHQDVLRWTGSPKPAHPVILVIDNDNGANSIYEAIAGITKKPKPKGLAPFIHVTANLYVVPTPPLGSKKTTDIECFFSASTLAEKLAGKTFNKSKDMDSDSEYGKAAFALNVVAKKADTIDFSGFDPLLKRISDAVQSYHSS